MIISLSYIVLHCAHTNLFSLLRSLVGNEDGTFPTQKAISEGKGSVELSEERRLCYVAMTRAKTHLVLTWRREVSYFAGSAFKTKDADRSRFLNILVSKREGAKKPKASSSAGLGKRSQTQAKKKQKSLNSMTKRELHSEANKYLSTNPTTGLRPKPRQSRKQVPVKGGHNSDANREMHGGASAYVEVDPITGLRPRQRQVNSQTKRGIHNEARSTKPANRPRPSIKSWDDWEPSSLKKPIEETPKIRRSLVQAKSNSPPPNNTRPPSTGRGYIGQQQRREIGKRELTTSSIRRRSEVTSNRTQNVKPIPSLTHPQRKSRDIIGELPPEMDSTMFYPVGSAVKHKFHGRGIVQEPPKADYAEFAEKMLVRVKFSDSNGEWDLPMESVAHTFDA